MINGSFTLVSEAIRLNLLPPLEIRYPSESILQEYIPAVTFLMWLLSCAAVVSFRTGQRMASVYGLTIAVVMLTTSVMLFVYLRARSLRCLAAVFGALELCFLIASLEKLLTGGVVTALFTLLLLAAMLAWNRGEEIESRFTERLALRDFLPQLSELRAEADYRVETFGTDCVFRLQLDLGYKCSRPLTRYLREAFQNMERQCLVPVSRKSYCLNEESGFGTFHYCLLRRRASGAEQFSTTELWALRLRKILQSLAGLREEWFTEEDTDIEVEWIPLSLIEEAPQERIRRLIREAEGKEEKEEAP